MNYFLITRINYCLCEIFDLATNEVKSCHCAAAAAAVVVDALRKEIPRRIVESHALWAGTVGGRAREREGGCWWGRLSNLMAFSSAKPRLHARRSCCSCS